MKHKVTLLILVTLIFSFLSLVAAYHPAFAQENAVDASVPNFSFENWSTQDGQFMPNKWVLDQPESAKNVISRSTTAFDGSYSLQLKAGSAPTIVRTHLFFTKGWTDQSQSLKLVLRAKSTNSSVETRGQLRLLDYVGFTLCQENFTIPAGNNNWTKQVLTCSQSSPKTAVTIVQKTSTPVLYDNVSVIAQ